MDINKIIKKLQASHLLERRLLYEHRGGHKVKVYPLDPSSQKKMMDV